MKESITRQIPTINEKPFLFGEQNLCDTVAQYNIQRGYDPEKAQYKAEATFSRICFLNETNDNLPKGVVKLPLQKALHDIFNPYDQIALTKKSLIRHPIEIRKMKINHTQSTVHIYEGEYNTFINVFPIPYEDDKRCWIMNNYTKKVSPFFINNREVPCTYLTSDHEHREIITVPKPKEGKTKYYVEKPFLCLADKPYTEKQEKHIMQMVDEMKLSTNEYDPTTAVLKVRQMLFLKSK